MAQPSSDATQLILQGFMTKQGVIHKSWKKRWFCNTLEDPYTLSYYVDETCKEKKGSIDLREVYHFRTKVDNKERGPKQRVGIALVTPSRTWKLIAIGSTNGDYWTSGLERLIHKARRTGTDAPAAGGAGAAPAGATASTPAAAPAAASVAAPAPIVPPTTGAAKASGPQAISAPQPLKAPEKVDDDVDFSGVKEDGANPAGASATAGSGAPAAAGGATAAVPAAGADADNKKPRPTATALFPYTASNANELSFAKGDKLTILQKDDDAGWWAAELNGKRGWVSSFYVAIDP